MVFYSKEGVVLECNAPYVFVFVLVSGFVVYTSAFMSKTPKVGFKTWCFSRVSTRLFVL